jgi:predicted acyl esterase
MCRYAWKTTLQTTRTFPMSHRKSFFTNRILMSILSLFFIFGSVEPTLAERVDSGVPGMLFEHNVPVAMTDGVRLRVNIYRPENPGHYPVLMSMGPYGKDSRMDSVPAYSASWARLIAKYPDLCKKSSCRYLRFEEADPERWVPQGYIVIDADSRGAGSSPGMLDPFSPREIDDYATLITWAAHQTWSSGKVGLIGTSYQAINQWMVAARQPAGLAAILPWDGAFDYYREIAYYGGILNPAWKFWWDHQVVPEQNGNGKSPLKDMVDGHLTTGEALSAELLKQNRIDPVQAWVSHPYDGAYYHERTPDGSRIAVPLLCVANWEDWSTVGYMAAASKSKWLRIETGDHLTPFYSEESFELQKRFFDHFLKGAKDGWDKEPPVSVQFRRPDGTSWKTDTAWPLPETQWTRYYLDAGGGKMGPDRNGSAATEKSYASMGDGLIFKTEPFNEDVEFTGPVAVKLWVRSSTADMDIFAALHLIDPEGREITFTGNTDPHVPVDLGFLRVSRRAVDPTKSTSYDSYHLQTESEPMVPGQIYEVDVNFAWPTSVVVSKGYQLALSIRGKDWQYPPNAEIVSSKDYELPFSTNPGLFFAAHPNRDPALYGGTNTVATGAGQSSYLLLPLIPSRH